MFPQGTVFDSLPNIATTRSNTRIRFPEPGAVERSPDRSRKVNSQHVTTLGFAYVNDIGRAAFQREPFVFPTGTIIARERLLTRSASPDILVAMIKRERRFNRKANGWEFLTVNGDMTKVIKREKDGECLKCHSSAAHNDFVFREVRRR